ncbi:MAG: peptide deformylase [Bradymonadaceae bacterium]
MAILDIVLYPSDILNVRCAPVDTVDGGIRQLVDDMAETMYDAPGIGLAAPQIGVDKRITVIDVAHRDEEKDLHVFINPEIIDREGKILWEEGCLSIPGIYEKVQRSEKVVVRALDRDGNPFELEAEEILAVALQHEIDHLDGVLFLDHLSHLKRRLALKRYKKLLARAAESDEDAPPGAAT